MSRRFQENIVLVLLLAFFVMILVISLGYGPNTRMVPLPVAIAAIVLIVFQFAWQNLRSADELNVDVLAVLTRRRATPDAGQAGAAKRAGAPPDGEWKRIAQIFAMIAVLVVVIMAIGPIFAVFLFTAAYFAISGHFPLVKSVIYAALFTAAGYLLFIQILQIQPYYGLLDPLMGN